MTFSALRGEIQQKYNIPHFSCLKQIVQDSWKNSHVCLICKTELFHTLKEWDPLCCGLGMKVPKIMSNATANWYNALRQIIWRIYNFPQNKWFYSCLLLLSLPVQNESTGWNEPSRDATFSAVVWLEVTTGNVLEELEHIKQGVEGVTQPQYNEWGLGLCRMCDKCTKRRFLTV